MSQTSSLAGTTLKTTFQAESNGGAAGVVAPAAGNTVVLTCMLLGMVQHLAVGITVGIHPIDGFLVEVQFHPNGGWVTLTNAVTAAPAGLVLAASGTLASQVAGDGWVVLDVRGIYAVRFSASGTVDDTTTVVARAFGS